MKKTIKTNTIKTKVMAAVLAAVTMASAGAMIPTSVCAADFSTTEIVSTASEFKDAAESLLNRISDKDLEKLKNVGISTLLAYMINYISFIIYINIYLKIFFQIFFIIKHFNFFIFS